MCVVSRPAGAGRAAWYARIVIPLLPAVFGGGAVRPASPFKKEQQATARSIKWLLCWAAPPGVSAGSPPGRANGGGLVLAGGRAAGGGSAGTRSDHEGGGGMAGRQRRD